MDGVRNSAGTRNIVTTADAARQLKLLCIDMDMDNKSIVAICNGERMKYLLWAVVHLGRLRTLAVYFSENQLRQSS